VLLDQRAKAPVVSEYIKNYLRENRTYILYYFMKIKENVNAEELRFY